MAGVSPAAAVVLQGWKKAAADEPQALLMKGRIEIPEPRQLEPYAVAG